MPSIPNLKGSSLLIATPHLLTESMLKAIGPAWAADFHGFTGVTAERNHTLLGLGKLVLEFSKICNFTPVATFLGDVLGKKINEDAYYGTIIPLVVPRILPTQYYLPTATKASVSFSVLQFFNFLYCDLDRHFQATNPALLLRPFDTACWVVILIASIILSLVLNWKGNQFFRHFYMVFAAIFSQTVSSLVRDRSKLLLLWIFGCLVLNTLYSGILTSVLIAPVEKDVMKSVDDLVKRDFHLVYSKDGYFKYIMNMAVNMEPKTGMEINGILKPDENGHQKRSALDILSKSMVIKQTTPDMLESLAFGTNTAIFAPWMLALYQWRVFSLQNEERNKKEKKRKRRSCHIGKYLTSARAHPEMWIFKMTDRKSSQDFSHVFNRLYANGIHGFWMGVFAQMQASLRIQDMNRYISKTEVKEEIPIEPLGFHIGSVVVIFVVFGISIFVSCLGFLLEILWSRQNSVNKF